MSYLALARKYRPQNFAELIGQEHVTQTILNAFEQQKLGQSYIFTGTRGVGKTSAARLLAKALCCSDPNSQPGKKNYGIPCNKCPSCEEIIAQGSSLDVIEIDGASNNGVENVREIRNNVKFMPAKGQKKVYIIDEVHMLSGAAFNALLKTLEEPPAHVTFIFATTEIHKVPATILSRCQRFDFKRASLLLIQEHIAKICEQEKISADKNALRTIAHKAEGSFRDALSLLDQVIALSGTEITEKSVSEALGIVERKLLLDILQLVFSNKAMNAVELLQTAFASGIEMKILATELAESLRNALFIKLGAQDALLDISEEEKTSLLKLVENLSPEKLQMAFQIMSQAIGEITRSALPKAQLEMTLIRIARIGPLSSVSELLAKVNRIEQNLGGSPNSGRQSTAMGAPRGQQPRTRAANVQPIQSSSPSWNNFVQTITQQKPSIGSLLENAVALTPVENWKKAKVIQIGFKRDSGFYLDQALLPMNFSKLEEILRTYTGNSTVQLKIDKAQSNTESINENKERKIFKQKQDIKNEILKNEVIQHTKRILEAELVSFKVMGNK